jgi:hypothetical protein
MPINRHATDRKLKVPSDPEGLFKREGKYDTCDEAALLDLLNSDGKVERVVYEGAALTLPHKLQGATFTDVWFKRTIIENARFYDCHFVDCRLLGVTFRNCEFHDCIFAHCNTHKIKFEQTYIDPKSFVRLPNQKDYSNIGVHLFQQLYRNAHEIFQPDFQNSAEYEFKLWKSFELEAKWRTGDPQRARIAKRWFGNIFFFLASGYGLRPSRIIAWLILFLMGTIAFNHMCWTLFDFHSGSGLSVKEATPELAIYYSIVTLTTLGYGDITPQSIFGLRAASVEVIFGLVGLALLASALIKKVLR